MFEQVFANRVGYLTVKISLNFLRHYFYIIVYRTYNYPHIVQHLNAMKVCLSYFKMLHSISHNLVWSYSLGKVQLVNAFKFMSQQHII